MSQRLEKQLENVLLDLTKDNQNSDSTDLNPLPREIHTHQGLLEKQKNDLQQKNLKLKKSRNDYQRLYDSAPAAFFILNSQGVILDVNFAGSELIGVGKNQLINSDLSQHVAPDFMDAFFYHRRWTLETDVKQTCELKLVKGDCSSFFVRLESKSLATDDRDQPHIHTIITDINDQKQMEGALDVAKTRASEAGKIKGEFLSKMSHEFRTPLNHIIGFTELALEEGSGNLNTAQKEYLDAVAQSSHHLLTLVKDILDLSKLEAGTLEFEPTEVRLKTLLENGLAEFEQKAIDHGAGIGLSLAKNLVELQGGKIWVESAGESNGSTFRFILPI